MPRKSREQDEERDGVLEGADRPLGDVGEELLDAFDAREAEANDNPQAELSEEGDVEGGDEATTDEAAAANKGRLARGEEPVVGSVVSDEPNQLSDAGGSYGNQAGFESLANAYAQLPDDVAGEDTISAKQSYVRRLVDGQIVQETPPGVSATGEVLGADGQDKTEQG
jgi:hypothetical protein